MAEEDTGGLKLFGFELKRVTKKKENKNLESIVPPVDDDGAGYVTASGLHSGQFLNLDGQDAKDSKELVNKYRAVSLHPDVDMAIEEIVNESISASELRSSVELSLDDVDTSDKIKKDMQEEFDQVVSMLKFNELGHDIFRSWYIDGRIVHHLVVDDKNLKLGIQEIRPIDAAKIKKVKQVKYKKNQETGVEVVDKVDEFYVFEKTSPKNPAIAGVSHGVQLSVDAVSYVTSGMLDETRKKVVSHLHKSLKSINQLRWMEDSLVIYRLARAPERRIFYVDVGNMAKGKAEEYMKGIMSRYRNKLVYDASTGELKDDRKHMSMLEDFWLPRREGGKGTEITTLPGGENLGQIDDILYFQKKLYRALNVPISRLEQETSFSLGRSSEITREELKFQKFIDRLRRRFSNVFLGVLKKQLLLKGIITEQDWDDWKNDIFVDFVRDNQFTELKELEIFRERIAALNEIAPYVGEYYTKEWVMKNILRMSDGEYDEMDKDLETEPPPMGMEEEEPAPKAEPKSKPAPKAEPKPPSKSGAGSDADKPIPDKLASELASKLEVERYIPNGEEELIESMNRFVNKMNEE